MIFFLVGHSSNHNLNFKFILIIFFVGCIWFQSFDETLKNACLLFCPLTEKRWNPTILQPEIEQHAAFLGSIVLSSSSGAVIMSLKVRGFYIAIIILIFWVPNHSLTKFVVFVCWILLILLIILLVSQFVFPIYYHYIHCGWYLTQKLYQGYTMKF